MLHSRIISFNPLQTNCVVLWADGNPACTVVDPGMSSPESLQELLSCFSAHGLTPEAILLTHGHFDHIWGVNSLLEHFPVPVYLHPADKDIMEQLAAIFPGMSSAQFHRFRFETLPVADGQELPLGCGTLHVLHTPGHTPGSVCYYAPADHLLLSGDTLFAGCIGRTDLPGGDYDAIMASIQEKLLNLPGQTDVIPGHGQPTTIAREGMTNPFLEPFNEPADE